MQLYVYVAAIYAAVYVMLLDFSMPPHQLLLCTYVSKEMAHDHRQVWPSSAFKLGSSVDLQ